MAQDLMDLPPEGTAPPPDMSPANSMLKNLPKNNALFVCLYHKGNIKETCGQRGKAAQTEGNPIDDGVNLTSLSMVSPAESAPSHKFVPLQVSRHTVGAREDQDLLLFLLAKGCEAL